MSRWLGPDRTPLSTRHSLLQARTDTQQNKLDFFSDELLPQAIKALGQDGALPVDVFDRPLQMLQALLMFRRQRAVQDTV